MEGSIECDAGLWGLLGAQTSARNFSGCRGITEETSGFTSPPCMSTDEVPFFKEFDELFRLGPWPKLTALFFFFFFMIAQTGFREK